MSDTEMTEKRSSDEFEQEESSKKQKEEECSTEDLEEAMYQVKKCAAKGRAYLENKCKEHFEARNGFSPNSEEIDSVFNTLRDSMIDEDAAQSSSDEEEENSEEFSKMQNDISSAFEHVSDLGQEAGKKMQEHFKSLWCKENNGGEPSPEETEAVFYNLKHMCLNMVVVEEESETEEDYEPSELEKEACEAEEQESAEYDECAFDFPSQCKVAEEQYEKLCEKFTAEKGRCPTSEEADALLESFKTKLCDTSYGESDSDYEPEEEEQSEDEESCAEDTSLEEAEEMEIEEEEEEEQEFHCENKSDAFNYMEELEEPSSAEEEEDEEEEEPEAEEAEAEQEQETSKIQQAQEMSEPHQVCA